MRAFRVKIPTLWRQAFPGLMLGAVVGRLSRWIQGEPFSWPETLPMMAIAAVLVMSIYYLQPTLGGPQGIKAMNSWGFRRALKWSDIVSVGFGRMYGMQPSLKLLDRHGRAHWIARDTKDLGALHRLAVEHGGAHHPLAQALETPLHAL
jgi:hypothetical protein